MPLGIVSDDDFKSEVNNSATTIKIPIQPIVEQDEKLNEVPIISSDVLIKRFGPGRHEGDVNVPHSLRKLIGDASAIEGRSAGLELAASLGISPASVSAYNSPHNSSSLAESNKDDISDFLTMRKGRISKRAINKLGLAISLISENKLAELDAKGISSVAKDMAQVVKHMEPETKDRGDVAPVQFLMYAPQVKTETHYKTVVAKDNY